MIDKEQVDENWRAFGRTIVAYPEQARKAMTVFYISLVALGIVQGAIIASVMWLVVT